VVVERVLRNGKRMYVQGFKQELVRRCLQPGVSVAAVALAHGVNANLLRKWIDKHAGEVRVEATPVLLPVTIDTTAAPAQTPVAPRATAASASPEPCGSIEIQMHGARVTLRGEIDPRRLHLVLDALARRA